VCWFLKPAGQINITSPYHTCVWNISAMWCIRAEILSASNALHYKYDAPFRSAVCCATPWPIYNNISMNQLFLLTHTRLEGASFLLPTNSTGNPWALNLMPPTGSAKKLSRSNRAVWKEAASSKANTSTSKSVPRRIACLKGRYSKFSFLPSQNYAYQYATEHSNTCKIRSSWPGTHIFRAICSSAFCVLTPVNRSIRVVLPVLTSKLQTKIAYREAPRKTTFTSLVIVIGWCCGIFT